MSHQQQQTGVLLIAHGSRRPEANDDLRQLAELIRARSVYQIVEIAYLELAEPTIPQAARACVGRNVKSVLMLPYFLSAGAHVAGDLERIRRELAEQFPDVVFQLCPPLGLHPRIVDVVLERLEQGRHDNPPRESS